MSEMIVETPTAGESAREGSVRLATVAAVQSTGLQLLFDGSDAATSKIYKCNAACMFSVGDRVKVTKLSGTYLVDYVIGAPSSGGDVSSLTRGSYSVELTSQGYLLPSTVLFLGSTSKPWGAVYVKYHATLGTDSTSEVKLGASGGKLGFFGSSPVAQQTVANTATVATLITALKAYGLIN